jgi:hypothetical protein
MPKVALGCSVHSGWAVVVAVAEPRDGVEPDVVARYRATLLPEELPRMTYHAAADLPLVDAEALIEQVTAAAEAGARTELEGAVRGVTDGDVESCAVLGEERTLPELERILASHSLLHTAEGALYREVLVEAAQDLGMRAVLVPPKGVDALVTSTWGWTEGRQTTWLTKVGKELGPPWQKDHKQAVLAAMVALRS